MTKENINIWIAPTITGFASVIFGVILTLWVLSPPDIVKTGVVKMFLVIKIIVWALWLFSIVSMVVYALKYKQALINKTDSIDKMAKEISDKDDKIKLLLKQLNKQTDDELPPQDSPQNFQMLKRRLENDILVLAVWCIGTGYRFMDTRPHDEGNEELIMLYSTRDGENTKACDHAFKQFRDDERVLGIGDKGLRYYGLGDIKVNPGKIERVDLLAYIHSNWGDVIKSEYIGNILNPFKKIATKNYKKVFESDLWDCMKILKENKDLTFKGA